MRILRWAQRGLFGVAALTLGYCGFMILDAWSFQRMERRQFEELLSDRQQPKAVGSARAESGGLIGSIEIARLGLSVIVMEGTSSTTLRRAAGHIAGTALPGESGNIGISGHRDTFFRPLRNIRRDDVITVTTLRGEYRYRVVSTKVVGPAEVGVLGPSKREVLTLVTCYPFYFVGSAPDRFIVRAERL
ncbi:MAG TPA: class D sortase [Bryobacteraceae bacterium]|nr:class D sortase [Bryobacteraceae bacterium]